MAQAVPDQVQVFGTAGEDQLLATLENPNENGAPLVFLVDEDQGEWLKVLLPVRPNGSTGFIRAADVTVAENPYSIDIALSEHRLVVDQGRRGDRRTRRSAWARRRRPTPGGRYYLKELFAAARPERRLRALRVRAVRFSNVLEEFNGGTGVIGIHGTNEPEAIGTDVSHGCIRMSNEAITELAGILPLGTPVHITA